MPQQRTYESSDPASVPQIDAILSQIGKRLRGGQWKTTVTANYSEDGSRLVGESVAVEYIAEKVDANPTAVG